MGDGLDRFVGEYAPARIKLGRMSPRTLQTYANQAKLYIRPALGKRRVADVTRRDVERVIGRLPNATRNRVLALLSRLFNLFETWEWTRQENIRTIARSSFDVTLVVVGRLPVYRRIAAEATRMRAAGVNVKAISLHFGVDHHTVQKAICWFRQRST